MRNFSKTKANKQGTEIDNYVREVHVRKGPNGKVYLKNNSRREAFKLELES